MFREYAEMPPLRVERTIGDSGRGEPRSGLFPDPTNSGAIGENPRMGGGDGRQSDVARVDARPARI